VITAIRATSRTLADHLQAEFVLDPDLSSAFGPGGTLQVWLNTPSQMSATRAGLSVWLYRVAVDPSTRNLPPQRIASTRLRETPLPLRLHYLLAPITNSTADDAPETEQVILGKALQVLYDRPQLTGADLRDDFAGTETTITTRLEDLSIDELTRVWDALDTSYRTSVSYEVTVVAISARLREEVGPPVRVPVLDPAVIVGGTP
jgi:hypothetical protein